MPRPQRHVFVCMQNRPPGHPRPACSGKGSGEVYDELMFQWQNQNLFDRVMVTASGCLGPCHTGANVLVYPEGVMYGGVRKEDVAEIVERHLIGGEPVARLMVDKEFW